MGHRNTQCFTQMRDMELDPQHQTHAHPDPYFVVGSAPSVSQYHCPTTLPDSRNIPNNACQFRNANAISNGVMPYDGLPPHFPSGSIDTGAATASNFYNPYMNPSPGIGAGPLHQHHILHDQSLSSSSQGVSGFHTAMDDVRRNASLMDARGSCKRKSGEGIPHNFQLSNASASSSSSADPFNMVQYGCGVPVGEAASFTYHQFGGTSSNVGVEPERSMSNRPGAVGLEPVLAHNQDHTGQEIYMSQPFQPAPSWLDQQPRSSSGDVGTSTWNWAPTLPGPHFHGNAVSGSHGAQGYVGGTHTGNSINFPPPPIHQHHYSFPNSMTHMQGIISHDRGFHPPYGFATNNSSHRDLNLHAAVGHATNTSLHSGPSPHGAPGVAYNYTANPPRNGHRMYSPSRRRVLPVSTLRIHNSRRLRYLPTDEVAILEIPGFYEVGSSTDRHSGMRLDIDDMSYEELLALGEQIGNVKTGLSELEITSSLNTRSFTSSESCMDVEEAGCVDGKNEFCVICQSNYKKQEIVGILDCGHEYHSDCLKKWLLVKNICPICKASALDTTRTKEP